MRVAFLSLDFGLLLLALVAIIHVQGITASVEGCDPHLCVPAEHCEYPALRGSCGRSGATCCALIKEEHRTICRQHGGDCIDSCPSSLTKNAADCPVGTKCCVLV